MFITRSGTELNNIWYRQARGIAESKKPAPALDQDEEALTEDDASTLCEDTSLTEMDRLRQSAAQGAYRLTST